MRDGDSFGDGILESRPAEGLETTIESASAVGGGEKNPKAPGDARPGPRHQSLSEILLRPQILAPLCTLLGIMVTAGVQALTGIADRFNSYAMKQAEITNELELQRLEMEQAYLAEVLQNEDLQDLAFMTSESRDTIEEHRKQALLLLWELELLSEGTGRRKEFFEKLATGEIIDPLPSIGPPRNFSEANDSIQQADRRSLKNDGVVVYPGMRFSCGSTRGTIGCFVQHQDLSEGQNAPQLFALTTRSAFGDQELSVGLPCFDEMRVEIGRLFSWTPRSVNCDAALIALSSRCVVDSGKVPIRRELVDFEELERLAQEPGGILVKKIGAITHETFGRIVAQDVDVSISIVGDQVRRGVIRIVAANLNGQITSNGVFSTSGDSGAIVLTTDNRPLGMIFAGSGSTSYAVPIDRVFATLGIKSVHSAEHASIDPSTSDTPPATTSE